MFDDTEAKLLKEISIESKFWVVLKPIMKLPE